MSSQNGSKGRVDGVDQLVSKRLKERRIILGMSQQDLAKAVNVSIQQIQKYETASNRISSGKLYAFAKFLRMPITHFYKQVNDNDMKLTSVFAEDEIYYDSEDKNFTTEKETLNLVKAFNNIRNSESRKKLIELAKTMT